MRIGFVGTGHIARALVQGLARSPQADESILLSPRGQDTARGLSESFPGVRVAPDNQAVLDGSDIVVLSVRPADALDVLRALRFEQRHLLISLVAATPLRAVVPLAAPATVVRAVPIPTALFPGEARAEALFNRMGRALPVSSERDLSVVWSVTALISPTYALLDEVSRWLVRHGISEPLAREYTVGQFHGVLDLALDEGIAPFDELARGAATRGGLNEQAVRHLQKAGVYSAVSDALDAILARLRAADATLQRHDAPSGQAD